MGDTLDLARSNNTILAETRDYLRAPVLHVKREVRVQDGNKHGDSLSGEFESPLAVDLEMICLQV